MSVQSEMTKEQIDAAWEKYLSSDPPIPSFRVEFTDDEKKLIALRHHFESRNLK